MEWHEKRVVSEMPEYVKVVHPFRLVPVGAVFPAKWQYWPNWDENGSANICRGHDGNSVWHIEAEYFEPATLSDYTDYINSKKQ
jgi:hypothetical protein